MGSQQRRHRGRGLQAQFGFSLIEILSCGVVLGFALLGHAASTLSEHRLGRSNQQRGVALQAVRQFMERLRADDDFPGLLGRLRLWQTTAAHADAVPLQDGRLAWPATTYYPDFVGPADLQDFVVRVEVPLATTGSPSLREDVVEPFLGVPADLNADGTIDDLAHDLDYRALPVGVTFRWTVAGQPASETRVATWLAGRR